MTTITTVKTYRNRFIFVSKDASFTIKISYTFITPNQSVITAKPRPLDTQLHLHARCWPPPSTLIWIWWSWPPPPTSCSAQLPPENWRCRAREKKSFFLSSQPLFRINDHHYYYYYSYCLTRRNAGPHCYYYYSMQATTFPLLPTGSRYTTYEHTDISSKLRSPPPPS